MQRNAEKDCNVKTKYTGFTEVFRDRGVGSSTYENKRDFLN